MSLIEAALNIGATIFAIRNFEGGVVFLLLAAFYALDGVGNGTKVDKGALFLSKDVDHLDSSKLFKVASQLVLTVRRKQRLSQSDATERGVRRAHS